MRHPLQLTLLEWLHQWEDKTSIMVDTKEVKSKVGGLAITWLPHSSAGLMETPVSGGFRKNYNECIAGGPAAPKSRPDFWTITHTKSFVRPEAVKGIASIHVPVFHDGWTRFSEQGEFDIGATVMHPTTEYWALHHYATGSREYFEAKQAKGRSQGPGQWPIDEAYWDRYHKDVSNYTCNEMMKYEP